MAACTFALLAAASPAAAGEKAIWGPITLPDGSPAFPLYRDLGVDAWQAGVSWPAVAPSRPASPADPSDPAYAWPADLDAAVRQAGDIKIAVLVSGSPGWANGGRSSIWAPDPSDFAAFLTAASRRYPSIRRWMIWGEPNRGDRFQPNERNGSAGPVAYARILDAAYGALKAVSRRNTVIGGMTWTGGDVRPPVFLDKMRLPNGRRPRLDWFGHNPFPYRFPNLREIPAKGGWRDISDLDTFSKELRNAYGRKVKLWLSEFTVQSDHESREFKLTVNRRDQARWLAAAYRLVDGLPSVAGLGWLSLLDEPQSSGSLNWGLLTADGASKPALRAYRDAPAQRFRPGLRVRSGRGSVHVILRPRIGGTLRITLRKGAGRSLRIRRTVRPGRRLSLSLGGRRLRAGRYTLVVRAPRAARLTQRARVR